MPPPVPSACQGAGAPLARGVDVWFPGESSARVGGWGDGRIEDEIEDEIEGEGEGGLGGSDLGIVQMVQHPAAHVRAKAGPYDLEGKAVSA